MSEDTTVGTRPRWQGAALRLALLVVVAGGFAYAVGNRWADVRHSLGAVSPWYVVAAWLVATVGLVGPWRAWDAVVTELGDPIPRRASAEIFFVGQLGKYVPGAVWPVLLQMRLARPAGLSRTRVALSFVVTLIIGVASGLVLGTLAVPALLDDHRRVDAILLLALLPLAAVALHPRVLAAVVRILLRVTRRPATTVHVTAPGVMRALSGTCFFWVLGGSHVWLLCLALGASAGPALLVSVGGLALAVSLGPLLVLLPAGAGFREAVLVTVLTTVLPLPDAVAVALISRAVLVLGDGALALAAFLAARRDLVTGRDQDQAGTGARP